MIATQTALHGLAQALDAPRAEGTARGNWRWLVRHRVAAVREALNRESGTGGDAWLAARQSSLLRERALLTCRLTELGRDVLDSVGVEDVRAALQRLVVDVNHHIQRVHDLAYDSVEIELGGSE